MSQQGTRHERILFKLSEQQSRAFADWAYAQRVRHPERWRSIVARRLASHSVLIAVADDFTPEMRQYEQQYIAEWIKGYAKMHDLLAGSLFPSMKQFRAQYADDKMPPIVTITADPAPIATVMAGFIMPYLAIRQPHTHLWSELELRGLIDTLLDELEADDLTRFQQDEIRQKGVALLVRMLKSPVRHLSLTQFDRPILPPQENDEPKPPPPRRPSTLPETGFLYETPSVNGNEHELPEVPDSDTDSKFTQTEDMFRFDVPLPKKTDRLPPLPPLRDRLKKDDDDDDER